MGEQQIYLEIRRTEGTSVYSFKLSYTYLAMVALLLHHYGQLLLALTGGLILRDEFQIL